MKVIGITGGVGAGKSLIMDYIAANYKCEIYKADEVAHLLEAPGEDVYKQLIVLLGDKILNDDTTINKSAMASLIFDDDILLQKVNEIVHPAVVRYLKDKIEEAENIDVPLFFIEAALLIEGGLTPILDEIWYIRADEDVRIQRLIENRGYSLEKSKSIIDSQKSDEFYSKAADFIIDNSKDVDYAYMQINKRLEAFSWQE